MKNARPQTTEASALDKRNSNPTGNLFPVPDTHKGNGVAQAKFSGTDNPRELRAIHALMTRSMPREHLDKFVGCSNGPALVSRMRQKGLEIPCIKVPDFDRDGMPVRRGVFSFTEADRKKIIRWSGSSNQRGGIDLTLAGLIALAGACAALLLGLL